ncbi:Bacteroides conjugative transposon TraK protein [Mucilaginibacter pineti]|uniref:Bacteroides conjugative transposon TraK protein n=1 Tax=Mucilaginibacter pineti TaxID=1391627 RepID=A0A1G7IFP2_9SPHI|nr:conjugative transposon protein TraK [Mucilaginibacter pineti]SDF11435.1 Bacteroides conjugative transposon TraK protein [Mucilaginibacter pineti]
MIIKNIESKVRLATFLAAGSFIAALLMVGCVSFFAYRQVADARKSIYLLDAANVPVMARQTDVQLNRAAEYRADIARFHSLFFTLTPDDKFIEYQMKQAMYLVDESGMLQYNNLKERGFFNSVLSSSAVLTIRTDSIYLDEGRKYFRYYGTQKIDRRSSTITRSLITEGYLSDLETRSDNNPHAVLITRWKTLENKDLSNVQKNSF